MNSTAGFEVHPGYILFVASVVYSLSRILAETSPNRRIAKSTSSEKKEEEKEENSELSPTSFQVLVVGAGPAGATASYFLSHKYGLKVGLFDRKSFPRPKPCGDAWCAPALEILDEMKVLHKMESDGIIKAVTRGGFISPYGYECINSDGAQYGSVTGCKTYAIKRYIADKYLVDAATESELCSFVQSKILDAKYVEENGKDGYWLVTTVKESDTNAVPVETTYKAKVLLICDGSTSYLGQKLNLVKPLQKGVDAYCSHAYVKGSTHTWKDADGVMVFNTSVLPGYSALFRHYNDDMYLGTYILPGGRATSRSIHPLEYDLVERHPYIQAAFGKEYEWVAKSVVAPIRLAGGVLQSYDKQVLLVGDAAGQVDPLTGEGIHLAMKGARIAADCVGEMFLNGNFSLAASEAYGWRCWDSFGFELLCSSVAARVLALPSPVLLDAVAVVGQRRGQAFLDFFGEVMTGVKPKSAFLQPGLLLDIGFEYCRQLIIQYVLRRPDPLVPPDIGEGVVARRAEALKKKT